RAEQVDGTVADALLQAQEAVEHLQRDEVPGNGPCRQFLLAKEGKVVAEVAQAWLQVVRQSTARHPSGEAVEVASVGQQRVQRHAALGAEIVVEGADIVGKSGVVRGTLGRHEESPYSVQGGLSLLSAASACGLCPFYAALLLGQAHGKAVWHKPLDCGTQWAARGTWRERSAPSSVQGRKGRTMASYRGHLMVCSVLGAGYGAAGAWFLHLDWGPALLGAGVATLGGLLPDLDSDSGVPVRELFSLAATIVPLLMLHRLRLLGFTIEQTIVLLALI